LSSSYAAVVTLQWDANTEPDLDSYKIYYDRDSGEPYDGTDADQGPSPITLPVGDLPDPGNPEYSLTSLNDNETYFFVVTAYDTEDLESDYSNEVNTSRVTSITSTTADGYYNEVETVNITINFSEAVNLADGDLIVTLETGDTDQTVTISTIDSSTTASGTYTVEEGNNSSDLSVNSLALSSGATLQNAGGTNCSLSLPTGANLADNKDIIIDTVAPSSSATAPSSENSALTIIWTASDDTSGVASTEIWYKKDSGGTWADTGLTAQTGTSGSFSYAPPDGDGTYYFATLSTDNAGNVEEEPTGDGDDSTVYDTTSPDPPVITTNLGNDYSTTDSSITIQGTCAADTVAIYVNGSTDGVTYTAGETSWTYSGTLQSGANTFTITAYDAAGNISSAGLITVSNTNLWPDTPLLFSPENDETDVSLTPELKTDIFSDPDAVDTHAQTEWQISKEGDFSLLLLDITSTSHLTSLTVPQSILHEGITYYWRVRFYDNSLAASDWSEIYLFTTLTTSNDTDSNGIPDDQEVDSTVDLDGDGTSDIEQSDIKCVKTAVGDGMIGVSFKDSTTVRSIESLESIDPDTISDTTNKPENIPLGLITFELKVNNPGDTAELTLYLSGVTEESEEDLEDFLELAKWYKYDSINGWQDYSDYVTFNVDRKLVTLQLKDGDYGDADGTENGIIVDPSSPCTGLTTPEPAPTPSGGGGGGGGCFIATAAFGSR